MGGRAAFGLRRSAFFWGLKGLCLVCLLAVASPLWALNHAGFESVRFRHIGVDQGLPQSTVRSLSQDSLGFVWLATQDGLARYDGYEIRIFRFDSRDPLSLPDNHILAVESSGDGGLWVGGQNGGLSLWDPVSERFTSWHRGDGLGDGLASESVSALLADSHGGLWIGFFGGQLQRRAADGVITDVHRDAWSAMGSIRAIRSEAQRGVLVAGSGGVWWMDADSGEIRRVFSRWNNQPVDAHDARFGPDGRIWVATEQSGVLVVNPDTGHVDQRLGVAQGLSHDGARALLFDRRGRVWIGTFAGLNRLDLRTGELHRWLGDSSAVDGLSAARVQALMEDREGLIWVGTWVNGISLHDPRSEAFVVARPSPHSATALPGTVIVDVNPAENGQLWVTMHDRPELALLDPQKGVVRRIPVSIPGTEGRLQIRSTVQRANGELWLAMGALGIARIDPHDGTTQWFFEGDDSGWNAPGGELYDLIVDSEQTLWVASIGGGLARLCASCTRFERFRHDPENPRSLPGDEVQSLSESQRGGIWVGTRFSGMALFDPLNSTFTRYSAEPTNPHGLGHPAVTCFLEDSQDQLWLGTQGGGFYRAERNAENQILQFHRVDRADGLSADAIGRIIEDAQGTLWISSTAGISSYQPSTGRIRNFGAREGAQASGYFIGSGVKLDDGTIGFGGLRGLTLFDPAAVEPAPAPARVQISDIRLAGGERAQMRESPLQRDAEGGLQLVLDTQANDVFIDLTALTFASPDTLRYEYMLEGLDGEWRVTEARRRFAAYTNLPAGDYLFLARVSRHGEPVGEELRLPVRVMQIRTTMDWLALIAVPLAALAMAGMLAVGLLRHRDRLRAQRSERASQERLKLALWGTGDELWRYELGSGLMYRENPIHNVHEMQGKPAVPVSRLMPLVHPQDRDETNRALRALIAGEVETMDVTYRVRHEDGHWLWLRSRGRVLERDDKGRASVLVGTSSDVTELKTSQESLREVNRELEDRVAERTSELMRSNLELSSALGDLRMAQDQLVEQEKMAALGGLVAGIAHEINTPIGIGVTAASHLQEATIQFETALASNSITRSALQRFMEAARESADLVMRNLLRADKLVKSFKRVAVDQSSEARRTIDLAEYLDEVVTSLSPSLRRANHQVVLDVPTGIQMESYPGAIYQILSNLVQNSLNHGFAGWQSGGKIRVSAEQQGAKVKLSYIDNGQGMSEEVRKHVFDPFFTTRRGEGGSGLGMHIVYNLVTRAIGGTISCTSSPGQGVEIQILMPVIAPMPEEEPEPQTTP
ncbi:two-component regulator propeller domain-containing protein [Pseudomarimonas arenosa]|nr:two-component regulator propeller domain-containing protein [Pseudomarimonas arenosa]